MKPRDHTCTQCDKAYTKLEHLRRHERAHANIRPFQCDNPACGRSFVRHDALVRHQRLHLQGKGFRPFKQPQTAAESAAGTTALPTQHGNTSESGRDIAVPSADSEMSRFEDGSDLSATPGLPMATGSEAAALPDAPATVDPPLLGEAMNWDASLFDDVLLDFPLFQHGGEATAFLDTLTSSDYYNAALPTFASPVTSFARSLPDAEPQQYTGATVRIRNNAAVFNEIKRHWPISSDPVYTYADTNGIASDEQSFDGVRAELLAKPDFEAIVEPSSSFLETALHYYWRQTHPLFPVLHRPSFRTCDHHPLLLLAMCASGATAMATSHSLSFAASVFRRILTIIAKRWEPLVSLRHRHDLLLVIVLVCRNGLYYGRGAAISDVVGLHGALLAYARQLKLFARGGPYCLFAKRVPLQTESALWGAWIAQESSTRLANAIIALDDWIHTLVRDQQPPLPLGEMQLYLPCDDELFDAPTAEAWVAKAGVWLAEPPTVCYWIRRVFEEDGVDMGHMTLGQQQALLFAMYTQKRCRMIGVIWDHDAPLRDTYDPSFYRSLVNWWHAAKPPSARPGSSPADFVMIEFEALVNSMCVDLDKISQAAGSEGPEVAAPTIALLHRHWYGTPASRRAVLHASQVFRHVVGLAGSAVMPFTTPGASRYAIIIVWVYGLCDEKARGQEQVPQRGTSFCLTDNYDLASLGTYGVGLATSPEAQPPSTSAASTWLVHGGPAHLFQDEPVSTFAGRSMTLLNVARALSSFGNPCAEVTATITRCLSQAELEV